MRHAVTLEQAKHHHRQGDADVAERLYRSVLHIADTRVDALHYLGVLHHQQGDSAQAVDLVQQSLAIAPGYVDAHSNLGNIYKECGQLASAEACYWRALELSPGHPQAIGNLAVVLQAQGCVREARVAYLDWLQAFPGSAQAHYLYGRFLCSHAQERADIERALVAFRTSFGLDDAQLPALEALGVTLYGLGRIDEAAAVYRDWLARDPDNPIPRHMLAACGAADAPARADDGYVRELFDRFAESFDEQLIDRLGYRAPEALRDALGAIGDRLQVLDAGCGTGLCGPWLRAHARRLVGVDLSAGMLARAGRRGEYDQLVEAELTAWLLEHAASYDLIVSADTLVYFGDLEAVLGAMHGALLDGGRIAFSLEALDGAETSYRLAPSGRYQHAHDYVMQAMMQAGFAGVRIAPESLRKEAGEWVGGWVVTAHRAQGRG